MWYIGALLWCFGDLSDSQEESIECYIPMNILTFGTIKKIFKKSPADVAIIAVIILVLVYTVLPQSVQADVDISLAAKQISLEVAALQNEFLAYGKLPASDLRGPAYTMTVSTTAYNSLPGQTDATPDITASGTRTRHGVLAANFLPIGTRVKIPALYGDQVFIIEDRMNARYWYKMDIWMEDYQDALDFGVKNIEIEVYPNS